MLRSARLALLLARPPCWPPEPSVRLGGQQPTFKSTTALVEVDAVVLDKDGNFVPGLKAEDITILRERQAAEDPAVLHGDATTSGQTRGRSPARTPTQAQYGAHRVFVMLFDEAHLANDSLMRVKSGRRGLHPRHDSATGDAGGVFLNGGMYKGRLTVDKGELLAGVRAVQPAFENRQAILAPFASGRASRARSTRSRIADGAREVTDALGVKACQEDPAGLPERRRPRQRREPDPAEGAALRPPGADDDRSGRSQNLETVARGLAKIPGPQDRRAS